MNTTNNAITSAERKLRAAKRQLERLTWLDSHQAYVRAVKAVERAERALMDACMAR